MGLALALEDFDRTPVHAVASPDGAGPAPGWTDGHAAGYAEATAAARADQEALDAVLVQRLEDMAFGYAEARSLLMADLVPFFAALSQTLLPALEDDLLSAHLAQALLEASSQDLTGPLILRVSAVDVVSVSDRLATCTGLPFVCRSDPGLAPGTAVVSGGRTETSLDTARLTDDLRAILNACIDQHQPEAAHG